MGVHFTVETDHKALSFINSAKTLTGHLAGWALLLQEFDDIALAPKIQMLTPFLVSFPRISVMNGFTFFSEGGDVVPCPNMNTDIFRICMHVCMCMSHS